MEKADGKGGGVKRRSFLGLSLVGLGTLVDKSWGIEAKQPEVVAAVADVKKCCMNCARWQQSSEEWEHHRWNDVLYQRVIDDFENDEAQTEIARKEVEERGGVWRSGRSLLRASCLGLGWGKWGCCTQDFGRGKAILCWDEKRGHHAPLYMHLATAHDFYCSEWDLEVEREPTISLVPVLEDANEIMKCPTCGDEVTLYLQRDELTRQEYWKGECKTCQVQWIRS